MEPGDGEAARPLLVDGEGGLRWSFGSKDVRQGFLELPSSFSTDQFLGFDGFLTCGKKFTLYATLYIGFLDRIVVGKYSNTFVVCIELYLMKTQKKSGRE
jgi:hypothetical protein